MKYDFGCGAFKQDGYIGVDIKEYDGVDIVCDILKDGFKKFHQNTAKEICSCGLVEHFKTSEFLEILRLWNYMLIPGGQLIIYFPDLEKASKDLCKCKGMYGETIALHFAYGGQNDEHDKHRSFWTLETMKDFIQRHCNFIFVREIEYKGKMHLVSPEHHNAGSEPLVWISGVEAVKGE